MVLWVTPPGPDTILGSHAAWPDLLITHEDAHLVHLLRPSRNPLRRLMAGVLPFFTGPIGSAPRWVSEGYATVLEWELTGGGRPFNDHRAAILRKWAIEGCLPSYAQLNSDSENWLGMSMAYLAGSAYLEWLSERGGETAMRDLWARATSRTGRSFNDAFEGIFGDAPQVLYGRFTAELTQRAKNLEDLIEPTQREGELWLDLSWTTGSLTVSPDGDKVAAILRPKQKPARLVVWSVDDTKDEAEWAKKLEEQQKKDPEDVAARVRRPRRRKIVHELNRRSDSLPSDLRWSADGSSLFFTSLEVDSDGLYRSDLFSWQLGTNAVDRLTTNGDVREFDPAPDGKWGIAVRVRHGLSRLVRISLPDGRITELTAPSLVETLHQPHVSPDGKTIVFGRRTDDGWRLFLRDVASGREEQVTVPREGALVSTPVWSRDGSSIYATVSHGGLIDVWRLDRSGGATQLTRSVGAAFSPAPAPDGWTYFLSLDPAGYDIRRIREKAEPVPRLPLQPAFEPVIRRTPGVVEPLTPLAEVPASRKYGIGRLELMPLIGGIASSDEKLVEAGLRLGDVVGRFDLAAILSRGGESSEGESLAVRYRGLPFEIAAHLFHVDETFSESRGVELSTAWSRESLVAALDVWMAALFEDDDDRGSDLAGESGIRLDGMPLIRRWRFPYLAEVRYQWGDERFGRARAKLGIGRGSSTASVELDWADASAPLLTGGGFLSSVYSPMLTSRHREIGALPHRALRGDEIQTQRLLLDTPLFPLELFYERHRASTEDVAGDWISVAGGELTFSYDAYPLLRLPAVDLRFGYGRTLDEPYEDEDSLWLRVRWTP